MNKKKKLIFFLYLILFNSFFVFAQNNSSTNQTQQVNNSSLNVVNKTKVELAFQCLETELKEDCSGARTVEQLAFAILATPKESILKECIKKLESKEKSEGCFGDSSCSIKDSALAILALNHVRKNTTKYEKWLLSKNLSSSEVEWIVQQDSDGETSCTLKYGGNDYQFIARENKKLTGNFGSCFSLTNNNYWLKVNEECFNKEIKMGCNKKFYVSLSYRTPGSQKVNILSNTKEGAQNSEVTFSIDSKCFGISSCNYEETVWAVLALKKVGHDIKPYIPYIVSSEETKKPYFPEIFSYIVLEYDSLYGAKIMKMQTESKYFEAENSAYGRFYDSALVLLALGDRNQQQIKNAKDWVWFSQENNGCWNSKNLRDTSILLWALERKVSPSLDSQEVIRTTKCSESISGATCIKELDCLNSGGSVLRNYDCSYSSISFSVCCNITPTLKRCSELGGNVCSTDEKCEGIVRNSSDRMCCIGECKKIEEEKKQDECSLEKGICRNSCRTNEEKTESACSDRGKVCCVKKETPKKSLLWLWVLLGILVVFAIIGILMKDKIKVMIYKNKQSKNESEKPFNTGLGPSKPGFPPIAMNKPLINKPLVQPRPLMGQLPSKPKTDSSQRPDVFNKLKEMSK